MNECCWIVEVIPVHHTPIRMGWDGIGCDDDGDV